VVVLPGEDELGALAAGALRVLSGEEAARDYAPPPAGR
jgi:butyrate kinase